MKTEISILKKRVYAFTIDLGIVTVANYFLMAAFTQFIQTVFFHLPMRAQLVLIDKMGTMSSVSLMSLTFAYFSLFYFMTNGRTMGKTLFALKAQNTDHTDLTLNQSMLRALAYFTCAMTGSFLFALSFIRKDEKSLADVFSGTHVVADVPEEITEFKSVLKLATDEPAIEYAQDEKEAA